MRSTTPANSSSSSNKQQPKPAHLPQAAAAGAAAAAEASLAQPSSPTAGLKLDQRATSQLIWTSSCPDLFIQEQQHQQEQQGKAASDVQGGSSSSRSGVTTQGPAAACDTRACQDGDSSFVTAQSAQSQLLDMSYISPLRSAAVSSCANSLGRKYTGDETPCSRPGSYVLPDAGKITPAQPVTHLPLGGLSHSGIADVGTPLSAQSLSAFTPGTDAAVPSPRIRRALQALSPLRRVGKPHASSSTAAAAAAADSRGCSSAGSSSSSSSTSLATGAFSELLTPRPLQQQQQCGMESAAAPGTACSKLTLRNTPYSNLRPFGSNMSVCSVSSSSKPGASGRGALSLQPEFRLAAADSMWPSPAAARMRGLGLAAADAGGSAVSSHMLWLQQPEEECEGLADEGQSPQGLCPRAFTEFDFMQGAGDSCSQGEGEAAGCGERRSAACSTVARRRSRRRGVAAAMLCVGACAAVGAAAWKHKPAEVMQLVSAMQQGASAAAGQARGCVAAGMKQVSAMRRQAGRSRGVQECQSSPSPLLQGSGCSSHNSVQQPEQLPEQTS
jgi:hypothetical protein